MTTEMSTTVAGISEALIHTNATDTKHRSKPPQEDCPPDYNSSIAELEPQMRLILSDCRVPWLVQHMLAEADMITTADLVQAYTPELLASSFDTDFKLQKAFNYTPMMEKRAIGRLQSALLQAKTTQEERTKRRQPDINDTNETSHNERHQLEGVWTMKTKLPAPPLSEQGSSKFMMKLFKSIQQNDIGDFSNTQIISENPDGHDKTYKKRRRESYHDGSSKEVEEESWLDPQDYDSWERQMTIWRNTLLMCVWGNPQELKLQITKIQLDEFYNYLLGDDIYKRKPQPSLRTMMISERKCWRKIREHLHKGTTLADSLTKMINDTLFWQREVYEYIVKTGFPPKGQGKGSLKGQPGKGLPYGKGSKQWNNTWPKPMIFPTATPQQYAPQQYAPQQYASQSQPKGSPKGKQFKGKAPKGKATKGSPSTWAAADSNNVPFCNNFHIRNNCPGQCGRSHECPITKQGWRCPHTHSAAVCPDR